VSQNKGDQELADVNLARVSVTTHESAILNHHSVLSLTLACVKRAATISCDKTRAHANDIYKTTLPSIPTFSSTTIHIQPRIMATFELSQQVAKGKQSAKHLYINLKALHQILKDTDTDATILWDLSLCVANAQKLSTETFLFIEKEAEKYVFSNLVRGQKLI
jgi:hypothetical protein